MTTLEILQKDLPVYIWERIVRYRMDKHVIDPNYYYTHELFDLIEWRDTEEGWAFWIDLYNAYRPSAPSKNFWEPNKNPTTKMLESIFRKHGVPLEVPSGEA